MGRRRRKVIRIPKKKLPDIFTCPKCGNRSLSININQLSAKIGLKCGLCGEEIISPLGQRETTILCPKCQKTIATISINEDKVKIDCEICSKTNFFEKTNEWMLFNCSCPPTKQSQFMTHQPKKQATIKCGQCKLNVYLEASRTDQKIDLYNKFFDAYYEGRFRKQ